MDHGDLGQALESGNVEKVIEFVDSATTDALLSRATDSDDGSIAQLILQKARENQALAASLQEKIPKLAVKNADGFSVLDQLVTTPAGGHLVKEVVLQPLLVAHNEDVLSQLAMAGWSDFSLPPDVEGSEETKSLISKLTDLRIKATLVQAAIRDGRLEDVQSVLTETDTVLRAAGIIGLLPLHQAVVYQDTDIVGYIVETFPQALGLKDNMGRTALHYAAGCHDGGNLFHYQVLKEAGADETVIDKTGNTPVYYRENPEMIQLSEIKLKLESLMKGQGPSDPKHDSRPASAEKAEDNVQLELQKPDTTPQTPPRYESPPGPKVVTPVAMYVSQGGINQTKAPPPSTVDGKYIAQHLGTALTLALAEIAEKRPWDPIEYLAKWLYKYHQNEAYVKQQAEMLKTIREAEERQNEIEELKFKRKEELLRLKEEEMIKQKEEEEEKKRQEMEELQRSNKEAALAQKPQLPTVKEDEEAETDLEADNDPNVKDRDTEGLTEMHKLASQQDIDLSSLMNLGYSIGDRDIKGRSVRDIAKEAGRTETINAIDNYIKKLQADGAIDTLEKLVLEGYDDFEIQPDDSLPEATRNFLHNIDNLKEQINSTFNLSGSGKEEEIRETLDAQPQLKLVKDKEGRSLLHRAVMSGQTTVVEYLATHHPDMICTRDNANRTPLHYAYGTTEAMATLLIAKGAKQTAKDVYKRTASFYKDNPESLTTTGNIISNGHEQPTKSPTGSANEADTSLPDTGEADVTFDPSQLATTSVTTADPEIQTSQHAQED